MTAPVIQNTRRFLALWALLLFLMMVAAVLAHVVTGRAIIRMRENHPYAYLKEADRLMKQGDFTGALAQVEEARRRAPENPDVDVAAGHVYVRFKRWESALEAYDKAITKGSENPGMRTNVLWALIELDRYDEVSERGKQWIAEGSTDPTIARCVAEACISSGDAAGAIPYLELALKSRPKDLALLDRLERAYRAAGAAEKAEQVREKRREIEADRTPSG